MELFVIGAPGGTDRSSQTKPHFPPFGLNGMALMKKSTERDLSRKISNRKKNTFLVVKRVSSACAQRTADHPIWARVNNSIVINLDLIMLGMDYHSKYWKMAQFMVGYSIGLLSKRCINFSYTMCIRFGFSQSICTRVDVCICDYETQSFISRKFRLISKHLISMFNHQPIHPTNGHISMITLSLMYTDVSVSVQCHPFHNWSSLKCTLVHGYLCLNGGNYSSLAKETNNPILGWKFGYWIFTLIQGNWN